MNGVMTALLSLPYDTAVLSGSMSLAGPRL